ncbi:MAG: hypothetical protein QG643_2431 [Pseudomonadota bacterium]|nr:hypothetical protein [Pseudomonadota bacterium]
MSIITLEWLHARCADVDGCLVWKLAAAHGTDPQTRIGGRKGKILLVRRLLWQFVHGRPFPRNSIARVECDTPLCVHPDHIIAAAKRDVLKGRALPLQHRMAIATSKRASSHLAQDDIERIRASAAPLAVVAAEHDIDPTYVSAIRLGKVRRDYSNPYLALA